MKDRKIFFNNPIISILLCLFFFSAPTYCKAETGALRSINGGGVILTFDDDHILDWYNIDQLLRQYKWKATFFVSHFNLLNKDDIERLKTLQHRGHEIASHSKNHINATKFISENSINEHFATDILPSINAMKKEGFIISSFAYPYGARFIPSKVPIGATIVNKLDYMLFRNRVNELDSLLLNHFKIIRATSSGRKVPSKQNNYANGSRLVFGLGIDNSYGYDIDYILEMLKYAKENNKITIFYAHRITHNNDPPKYTITSEVLEKICQYVVRNNMHFMTMKDLVTDQK